MQNKRLQELAGAIRGKWTLRELIGAMEPELCTPGPSILLDRRRWKAFEDMWHSTEKGKGVSIDYALEFPKYEFLSYLVSTDIAVLHGSSNSSIEVFEPRQSSCASKMGNSKAVFASSDPLQPIFYAIVNRRKKLLLNLSGAWRWLADRRSRVYFFAMDYEALQLEPWDEGVVYILPRQRFTPDFDGIQWICTEPVEPLAKLHVGPPDFPLLRKVQGYNSIRFIERMLRTLDGFPYTNDPEIYPTRHEQPQA